MNSEQFAKGTEQLVDPISVGSIHFLQQFYGLLPRGIQRKVLTQASRTTPYMGFVVEPYASFLFYEVTDPKRAAALLPPGFRLAKSRVFTGDEPSYFAIIGAFRVHTSAFWGARAEFYLVAEDERTNRLAWIIVDYMSDTISYDDAHALRGPSAPGSAVTTLSDARVLVDMSQECEVQSENSAAQRAFSSGQSNARLVFDASLVRACTRPLDQELWVEGNLSVGYGPTLSPRSADLFALTFLPDQMTEALDIPLASVHVHEMTWYADILAGEPTRCACFPYAQHFLSDSPGCSSSYATEADLRAAAQAVDFNTLSTFSTASIRTGMIAGTILTLGGLTALTCALIKQRRSNR